MAKIKVFYPLDGLRIDPDLFEQLEIDEKAIQTLASLFGWDGQARRMITCSSHGSLNTVSPHVVGITNVFSTYPTEDITFDNIPVTEVMIMADPTNDGNIWVNVGAAAAVDTGWPLDAGDIIKFSINNMQELYLHVITNSDGVIIIKAG